MANIYRYAASCTTTENWPWASVGAVTCAFGELLQRITDIVRQSVWRSRRVLVLAI